MNINEYTLLEDVASVTGWTGAPAGIEALKYIVENKSARILYWEGFGGQDIDDEGHAGIFCDMQTANALVTVYNALDAANKARMEAELARSPGHFMRMVNFAWSHVK